MTWQDYDDFFNNPWKPVLQLEGGFIHIGRTSGIITVTNQAGDWEWDTFLILFYFKRFQEQPGVLPVQFIAR